MEVFTFLISIVSGSQTSSNQVGLSKAKLEKTMAL